MRENRKQAQKRKDTSGRDKTKLENPGRAYTATVTGEDKTKTQQTRSQQK
jgi:hypothetical protein